jgi:hypothetical protein
MRSAVISVARFMRSSKNNLEVAGAAGSGTEDFSVSSNCRVNIKAVGMDCFSASPV